MEWYSLVTYCAAILGIYILAHLALRHLHRMQLYRTALLRVLYLYGIHRVYWPRSDAIDDTINDAIERMEEESLGG